VSTVYKCDITEWQLDNNSSISGVLSSLQTADPIAPYICHYITLWNLWYLLNSQRSIL